MIPPRIVINLLFLYLNIYFTYPRREQGEVEVDGTFGGITRQIRQLLDGSEGREGFIHSNLLVVRGLQQLILNVMGLAITYKYKKIH